MMWAKIKNNQSGMVLVIAIVITSLFLVAASGLTGISLLQIKLNQQQLAKHQALHLAEAGINYYRWHLAHVQNDFMDGTGTDPGGGGAPYGPYNHSYSSPDGTVTGHFELEITPPAVGSTIIIMKSTGWLDSNPNIKRSIKVRYGIPSLARYSILSNTDIRFGSGAVINGEVHSNGGIKMDGSNDSLITSARTTWVCGTLFGCDSSNCNSPCVWASSQCTCPGVAGGGSGTALWNWPVLSISYNSFTNILSTMRDDAIADGSRYRASGSTVGYRIIFNNNGTYTIRNVTSLQANVSQWSDNWSAPSWVNYREEYNANSLVGTYNAPAHGVIFIEDGNAWIEGTVKGRYTVAVGSFPDQQANSTRNIIINHDITYLAKDGTNSLGLIAQKDIRVPRYAHDDLEINAIMLAQWGKVFYNNYQTNELKNTITVYGGTITNQGRAWGWSSGATVNDGFQNQVLTYDSSATFSPPPSFPTTGEYTLISWEEN